MTEKPPNSPESALVALHEHVALAVSEAQKLNALDQPTRCRSLSLALTNLEQAMHWVEDAYRTKAAEASR